MKLQGRWGSVGSLLILVCGCSGTEESIRVVFPDAATQDATGSLSITVFEPFIDEPGEIGRFLACDEVGTFSPAAILTPLGLGGAGTGQVGVARSSIDFANGFSAEVDLPILSESTRNPWGAVTVLVEAQGDVLERSGQRRTETLADGCRCVRTLEGSHSDRELDERVKQACAPLGAAGPSGPAIELGPVASRAFPLSVCASAQVNGPIGAVTVPGALACLRPVLCRQDPTARDCFECEGACPELDALGRVPVLFELEGGGLGSRSFLTVTDNSGVAEAQVDLSDCQGDFEMTARVLGRRDEQIRLQGSCVEPPPPFQCIGEIPLGDVGPVTSVTSVPGPPGQVDAVAVLQTSDTTDDAVVQVFDVGAGSILATAAFPGEDARGILGFEYGDGRSLLAVATGRSGIPTVRVFEWDGTNITSAATLTTPCPTWTCGSLAPCSPGGCPSGEACHEGRCVLEGVGDAECTAPEPVRCSCQLAVNFASRIVFTTTDIDEDGRADLAAASTAGTPITTWLSSGGQGGAPYTDGACRCSQHAKVPTEIAFGRLGGNDAEQPSLPDLALAETGGSFLVYGQENSNPGTLLQCGPALRFGEIQLARRVKTGRLSCPRGALGDPCSRYDDLVLISNLRLDATTMGAGRIRMVFGGPYTLEIQDDVFSMPGRWGEVYPRAPASDPRDVDIIDVNVDGHEDLAVLYANTREIRVWLGKSNRGFGELAEPIDIDRCEVGLGSFTNCAPLPELAVPDLDGDGGADLVVVCDALDQRARLRSFRSSR